MSTYGLPVATLPGLREGVEPVPHEGKDGEAHCHRGDDEAPIQQLVALHVTELCQQHLADTGTNESCKYINIVVIKV